MCIFFGKKYDEYVCRLLINRFFIDNVIDDY